MKIDNIDDVHIVVIGNGSAGRKVFKSVIENVKINRVEDMDYRKDQELEVTDKITIELDEFDLTGLHLIDEQRQFIAELSESIDNINNILSCQNNNKLANQFDDLAKELSEYNPEPKKEKKKTWKKNKFWE